MWGGGRLEGNFLATPLEGNFPLNPCKVISLQPPLEGNFPLTLARKFPWSPPPCVLSTQILSTVLKYLVLEYSVIKNSAIEYSVIKYSVLEYSVPGQENSLECRFLLESLVYFVSRFRHWEPRQLDGVVGLVAVLENVRSGSANPQTRLHPDVRHRARRLQLRRPEQRR